MYLMRLRLRIGRFRYRLRLRLTKWIGFHLVRDVFPEGAVVRLWLGLALLVVMIDEVAA